MAATAAAFVTSFDCSGASVTSGGDTSGPCGSSGTGLKVYENRKKFDHHSTENSRTGIFGYYDWTPVGSSKTKCSTYPAIADESNKLLHKRKAKEIIFSSKLLHC